MYAGSILSYIDHVKSHMPDASATLSQLFHAIMTQTLKHCNAKDLMTNPRDVKAAGPPPSRKLPQCWHCPEKHFNRDCPVKKAEEISQETKKTHQESWRRGAPLGMTAPQ